MKLSISISVNSRLDPTIPQSEYTAFANGHSTRQETFPMAEINTIDFLYPKITLSKKTIEATAKVAQLIFRPHVFPSFYQVKNKDGWLPEDKKICLLQEGKKLSAIRGLSFSFDSLAEFTDDNGNTYRFALGISAQTGPDKELKSYDFLFGGLNLIKLRGLPASRDFMAFLDKNDPIKIYLETFLECRYIYEAFSRNFLLETRASGKKWFIPPAKKFYTSLESRVVDCWLVDGELLMRLQLRSSTPDHTWELKMTVQAVQGLEWQSIPEIKDANGLYLFSSYTGIEKSMAFKADSVSDLLAKFPEIKGNIFLSFMMAATSLESKFVPDMERAVTEVLRRPGVEAHYFQKQLDKDKIYTFYSIEVGQVVYGNVMPVLKKPHDPMEGYRAKAVVLEPFMKTLQRMTNEGFCKIENIQMETLDLPFEKEVDLYKHYWEATFPLVKMRVGALKRIEQHAPALTPMALWAHEKAPFVHIQPLPRTDPDAGASDGFIINRYDYILSKLIMLAQRNPKQFTVQGYSDGGRRTTHQNLLQKKLIAQSIVRETYHAREASKPLPSPLFSVIESDIEMPLTSSAIFVIPISAGHTKKGLFVFSSQLGDFFQDGGLKPFVIDYEEAAPANCAAALRDHIASYANLNEDDVRMVFFCGSRREASRWHFTSAVHGLQSTIAAYIPATKDITFYAKSTVFVSDKNRQYLYAEDKSRMFFGFATDLPIKLKKEGYQRRMLTPFLVEVDPELSADDRVRLKFFITNIHRHALTLHVSHLPLGEPALLRLVKKAKELIINTLRFPQEEEFNNHLGKLSTLSNAMRQELKILEVDSKRNPQEKAQIIVIKNRDIMIVEKLRDLFMRSDVKLSESAAVKAIMNFSGRSEITQTQIDRFPIAVLG